MRESNESKKDETYTTLQTDLLNLEPASAKFEKNVNWLFDSQKTRTSQSTVKTKPFATLCEVLRHQGLQESDDLKKSLLAYIVQKQSEKRQKAPGAPYYLGFSDLHRIVENNHAIFIELGDFFCDIAPIEIESFGCIGLFFKTKLKSDKNLKAVFEKLLNENSIFVDEQALNIQKMGQSFGELVQTFSQGAHLEHFLDCIFNQNNISILKALTNDFEHAALFEGAYFINEFNNTQKNEPVYNAICQRIARCYDVANGMFSTLPENGESEITKKQSVFKAILRHTDDKSDFRGIYEREVERLTEMLLGKSAVTSVGGDERLFSNNKRNRSGASEIESTESPSKSAKFFYKV